MKFALLLVLAQMFVSFSHAEHRSPIYSCNLSRTASVYVYHNPNIGMIAYGGTHWVSYYIEGANLIVDSDTKGNNFSLDLQKLTFTGVDPDGQAISVNNISCGHVRE